jgi:tetratricopeptide (TPR) repeat protein
MDNKLQEALRMYNMGNYSGAIEILSGYIQDSKDSDGLANYYLGLSLYDSGRLSESEKHFKNAVSLNPKSAKYYYRLGLACARLMKFSEAIQYLTKAIELAEDNVRAKYMLGTVYFKIGNLQEAKKIFNEIKENNEENAAAVYYLGLCEYYLGNIEEAEKLFKRTLTINSDYLDAYKKLGDLYFTKHDYEEASKCYFKAYSRGIMDITLLLNYSLALIGLTKYDEAEEVLETASKNYPNNPEVEKLVEVFKDIKKL